MNGPIAQLVALACHGNGFLRRGPGTPFFPDNSTCRFCDRVIFVERRRRWFAHDQETRVAESPDAWFAHLARTGARGLRLSHGVRGVPRISDRMSAGLIGGGAVWTIAARHDDAVRHWSADWEVWDRNAPEQRIWRVTYRRGSTDRPQPLENDVAHAHVKLAEALQRIHAFAAAHDCSPFTESFRRALDSLAAPYPLHGYHADLCPADVATTMSRALLDAAQSAWVFGGMGSWNDLGFDGDAAREYDEASALLYSAIQDAICAAANEGDSPAHPA